MATAQAGGRHSGFLTNYAGRNASELRNARRSLTENIAEHEGFLRNPSSHVKNFAELRPQHQESLLRHWRNEIRDAREQIEIIARIP